MSRSSLFAALVLAALPLFAAPAPAPPRRYHLQLEAEPAAAFPYLRRFGAVSVDVYPAGVRAEALWLNAFARNQASAITVANPLGRMYVDLPVAGIAPLMRQIAGSDVGKERIAAPVRGPSVKGKVSGIDATRYRLLYGPAAWIDLWTTTVIPENTQMRRITDALVEGISPGTAAVARGIPGTPVYIELNFRRFQKVALLKVKTLTFDATAEQERDDLDLGSFYVKAPFIDKVLGAK